MNKPVTKLRVAAIVALLAYKEIEKQGYASSVFLGKAKEVLYRASEDIAGLDLDIELSLDGLGYLAERSLGITPLPAASNKNSYIYIYVASLIALHDISKLRCALSSVLELNIFSSVINDTIYKTLELNGMDKTEATAYISEMANEDWCDKIGVDIFKDILGI